MKRLILLSLVGLALVSCKKDPPPEPQLDKYESGMIVLNEGLFQQNNASISFYSFGDSQVYQQAYMEVNGQGLGDTANDMALYTQGDSTYIIVAIDISSQLEIINAKTMRSVAKIPVFDGTTARQPRHVIVNGDKAYSCNYDGTVAVVDLFSHVIIDIIQVGANPDGIANSGHKIYVSNSGGLNFPNYDSTVSVIDMNSNTELLKIKTGINPGLILADNEGDIYALSRGNYTDVEPAVYVIDFWADAVVDTLHKNITAWDFYDDWIYYYDANLNDVYRYHTISESFENVKYIECGSYSDFYGIEVNQNGIFTADANGFVNSSTIRCYTLQGGLQYTFTAGLNATDIEFN